jgi:hypothetical protein
MPFVDERSVSWKILLPAGEDLRVLASGLDAAEVAGLARTWRSVDCVAVRGSLDEATGAAPDLLERMTTLGELPPARGQYDIVVWAVRGDGECTSADVLAGMLRPGGTLTLVDAGGRCPRRRELERAGLGVSRTYLGLPRSRPRLFVPTSSARLLRRALRFHPPGGRAGRWMTALARPLVAVAGASVLGRPTVTICARPGGGSDRDDLSAWLARNLGCDVSDFVVYAGAGWGRRRITALACPRGGGQECIVKITDAPGGADANRREAEALAALAASPVAGSIPRLILAEGAWGHYRVQVQSAVADGGVGQVRELTGEHVAFLRRMSAINRRLVPLWQTDVWRSLRDPADAARLAGAPGAVGAAFRLATSDEFSRRTVLSHATHGDFVPWNVRRNGHGLFVIDWEEASQSGLALADVFTFIYRQAAYVGPWPGAAGVARAIRQASDRLAAVAGWPAFDHSAALLARMLREHLTLPHRRLDELFAHVVGGTAA